MNKVQKIRAEIERLYNQSLVDENRQAELGLKSAACTSYGKSKVCKELLSFIDSMQKEPKSFDEAIQEGDDVRYNEDLGCRVNLSQLKRVAKKEKSIDKDFEAALAKEWKGYVDRGAATVDALEDNTQELAFAKGFYRGSEWRKEQLEKNRLKHCDSITNEQAELESNFIDQHLDKYQRMPTFLDAIEYGMNLQKEQMMAKAVDVEVKVDAGGYPYIPQMELYDYDKDIPLAKEGDKYKAIIIKEE